VNQAEIDILKSTIAKGCSDLELALFLQVCDRTGLDPFAKQICPVLRWDKKSNGNVMAIQVQVDGYRVLAQRTGEYGGSDRPLFDEGLSLYEHKQTKRGKPETCTVTVYRINQGVKCAYTAEVAWSDFYPGDKLGFMWSAKPYQMISKTAEAQALRKAFQIELARLETPEELAIAPTPTRSQVARSPEWKEAQAKMLTASSAKEVSAIAVEAQQRVPVDRHEVDRAVAVAAELLIPPPPTAAGQLIKECRNSLGVGQEVVVRLLVENNFNVLSDIGEFDSSKIGGLSLDDAARAIKLIKAYAASRAPRNDLELTPPEPIEFASLPLADQYRANIKRSEGNRPALETIQTALTISGRAALGEPMANAIADQLAKAIAACPVEAIA
jgi:phage recombination protein Bet